MRRIMEPRRQKAFFLRFFCAGRDVQEGRPRTIGERVNVEWGRDQLFSFAGGTRSTRQSTSDVGWFAGVGLRKILSDSLRICRIHPSSV